MVALPESREPDSRDENQGGCERQRPIPRMPQSAVIAAATAIEPVA